MIASGGRAPLTWSLASGTLPPGLSLDAEGALAGTISSGVASGQAFGFEATVKDAADRATAAFSVAVHRQPEFVAPSLPDGAAAVPYRTADGAPIGFKLRFGKPPFSFEVAGLPDGLAYDAAQRAISGTPSSAAVGLHQVQVRAVDAASRSVERVLPLRVLDAGAMAITSVSPPSGPVDGGTRVRVLGFNLQQASVSVGGASVATTVAADGRSVSFTAPSADAPGDVTVVLSRPDGSSASAAFRYTLEKSPAIDGLGSEWMPAFRVGANATLSATGDELTALYAAYDADNLYLAVEGTTRPESALLLFIDVDGDASGAPLDALTDDAGALDAACSNAGLGTGAYDTSAVVGFKADLCVGSVGGAAVWFGATAPASERAGARTLRDGTDFGWSVDYRGRAMTQVASSSGFAELLLPWAVLFPGRGTPPSGARIRFFARIASGDGEELALQTLPQDDDTRPNVVTNVAKLEPRLSPRPGVDAAPWHQGATFYEVFVRSFKDSDGDGVGDLKGLISKLDYLNDGDPSTTSDLGVDALWLMPIFASPSYHGYDTVDYGAIDPDYGTMEDFIALCEAAHARGMRVILDLVLNHTSWDHPWFLDAAAGASAARRDWYVWSSTDPGWTQPFSSADAWHPRGDAWYYAAFWQGMPDLNYRTAAVREEAKRIASEWLARGADGFRLDAAHLLVETGPGEGQMHTAETLDFWREFSAHLRAERPDAILASEVWSDTNRIGPYYADRAAPEARAMQLSFDFPLSDRIFEAIADENAAAIASKLVEVRGVYPFDAVDAPFLTNHDMVRAATRLAGATDAERLAAAILLTLPGSPFLYYGEEVGVQNGAAGGDEAKRTPMPWDATAGGGFTTGTPWFPFAPERASDNVAAQVRDAGSLLGRYRALVQLRAQTPALSRGQHLELISSLGATGALVFVRGHGAERVLVAHNLSSMPAVVPRVAPGTELRPLLVDEGVTATSTASGWNLELSPRSSAVWAVH